MKKVAMLLIASLFALASTSAVAGYHYKHSGCCDYDNDWVYDHIKTRCAHPERLHVQNWEHDHKGHRFHVHGGILAPVDTLVRQVQQMPSINHYHHKVKRHHNHNQHHLKRYHRQHCSTCKTYWH